MNEDGFTATLDGTVLVAEIHDIRPDDPEEFRQRLLELLSRDVVTAFVAIDDTEGPVPPERLETIEQTAGIAAEKGIERVAIVGEGVKAIAVEGTADHPTLDVDRFEDRDAAIAWARND